MITFVFINGFFTTEFSDIKLLPKNIEIDFLKNGISVHIPKNYSVSEPIRLFFLSKEADMTYCPSIEIRAEENSHATIIEEYGAENATSYLTNTQTQIHAEKNACIHYYKIQNEDSTATHTATVTIQQKNESCVKTFFADFGSRVARENLQVSLAERAECRMHGLYFLNVDNQQLENHIHVDHLAEHGMSAMLYKGILDKKSRAAFKGKVYVHKDAQHINAQQANHNLLLSPYAEINTKPELEIYADDVKCIHGATVGQLDKESFFYLRSRGIEKNQAVQLLTHAFATEVISKIENQNMREYIQQRVGYTS